jgi:hypothetical protein
MAAVPSGMSDGSGLGDAPELEERVDEMAALALVADETRARILRALGDATVEREGLPRLSYTELREETGIRDSGRFNYHLSKLEGWWVRKRPDGYKLNGPGQQVYDALVSGSFTADAAPEPAKLADRCPYCHRRLTALYTTNDVRLLVVCDWCCFAGLNVQFPPNALASYGDPEALVDAGARHAAMETRQMVTGQCFACAGRVDATLHDRDPTEGLPWGLDTRPLDVYATFHCRSCTGFHYTTVGEIVSYHPRVEGFCATHGIEGFHDASDTDPSARRKWRHDWVVTDRHTTIESTDPWRVTVEIPSDTGSEHTASLAATDDEPRSGSTLRVTVDGTASVVDVTEH